MRTLSSLSCDTRAVFPHSPLVLLISPEWDTFHTTHSWGEWTLGFVVWDSLGTSEELPDKIRDMELDVNFRSTKKKKNHSWNANMSYTLFSLKVRPMQYVGHFTLKLCSVYPRITFN